MKTKTFVIILILVLAALIISSCATTPKTNEGRDVNQIVFFLSVMSGDYSQVKNSIKEGADVNVRNRWGETALLWASYVGHTEVVELLIEKGADINVLDNNGYTALMWASKKGHTEVVKLLKEAGAKE